MSVNRQGLIDVLVVSAFGRGNWLAAELAEKNIATTLIDVSDFMGRWAPEDWEGPFGCFHADTWTSSQSGRLTAEDYLDPVKDGFTVWTKEGPMDLQGLLVHSWTESKPEYQLAKKYLQAHSPHANEKFEDLKDDLLLSGFEKNWLAQLAHQLASPIFSANALAMTEGQPLPLAANMSVRRNTRKGLQKSLEWVRSKGADVLEAVKVEDLAVEGRQVTGVQVSGATSRVLRSAQVVWSLSSAETQFISPSSAGALFPHSILQPEWCWMRWRVQGSLGLYRDVIPLHFVLIDQIHLPWTHSNLLIVQRCTVEGSFDVWARIPSHHRFQRHYCEEFGQDIIQKLNQKLPQFLGQVTDLPQDYLYNADELGPSLWPVFDGRERKKWSPREFKNLQYDGVEWVSNLDWTGRYQRQNEILFQLLKWQSQELARQAKGGGGDRTVHTP